MVSGTVLFESAPRIPRGAAMQLSNDETGENFGGEISDKGQFEFDGVKPGRYTVVLRSGSGYFLRKMSATGAKITGALWRLPAAAACILPQSQDEAWRRSKESLSATVSRFPAP